MDNILWFDIESSDLPIHSARIITISFILNRKEKTLYINPGVPISPYASKVNGIYDKDVQEWKPFSYYAKAIFQACEQADGYGGYNCKSFDIPLLTVELLRCGYIMPIKPIIDTYEKVQFLFKSLKLSDIYRTLIGKELKGAHSSICDVQATIELDRHLYKNYYQIKS